MVENTGQPQAMRENAARIGILDLSMDDQERLFGHDVPADVFTEAGRRIQPQSGRPFADPWPLERWPDIPTRVISARDDRLFPAEFQQRVARERLGITPELIEGGHLAALSHPRQVVQKLDACTHERPTRSSLGSGAARERRAGVRVQCAHLPHGAAHARHDP